MIVWKLLKIALLTYCVVLLVVYIFQRHLLYFPQKYDFDLAESEYKDFTEVKLKAQDGADVYLWEKFSHDYAPTILYFHGNGETLPNVTELLREFSEAGYNVAAMEYRGYGKSREKISEQGIIHDSRAVMSYLKTKTQAKSIILYGRSLGTGVAVRTASENKVDGIVLHSPFTSVEDIAADIYSYFPIKFFGLVMDKFDSYSLIDKVRAPLLFICGVNDRLVPIINSEKLFEQAQEPKKFIKVENADHNYGFDDKIIIEQITEYFQDKK